jgi:hypothetical protein
MMNLVMFGWVTATPIFAESTDVNMKHMLYAAKVQQLEDEVIPVGNIPINAGEVHPFVEGWQVWNP